MKCKTCKNDNPDIYVDYSKPDICYECYLELFYAKKRQRRRINADRAPADSRVGWIGRVTAATAATAMSKPNRVTNRGY